MFKLPFGVREAKNVEEKYGKKMGEAKPLVIANSGLMLLAFVFIVAGAAVMGYSISKGGFNAVSIPLLLVGLALLAYIIKIMTGGVFCYENAIVIQEAFKTTVIPREDIGAIYWEQPHANVSNEKVRTNVTTADILLAGGKRHYKISDGAYSNVDCIGKYQEMYKIPREIVR